MKLVWMYFVLDLYICVINYFANWAPTFHCDHALWRIQMHQNNFAVNPQILKTVPYLKSLVMLNLFLIYWAIL